MTELLHLDLQILNNPLSHWLMAAGIAAAIVLAGTLVKRIGLRKVSTFAPLTKTRIDDAVVSLLQGVRLWLVVLIALWAGSEILNLPAKPDKLLTKAATVAIFLQVGIWGGRIIEFWFNRSAARVAEENIGATTSLSAMAFVGRVLVWTLILLLAMDNLGINVNALVTSLGIGGIAVALAVQNVLGDLFASMSIVMDKPFVAGDFIVVDDYMGTVEHVGLKSTRLRSVNGEQIILSNSDILKSRLRNYKRMHERRREFTFRIAYETPIEKLEKIPALVRAIVERQKSVRFERAHFKALGDASLDFEVVYWMTDPDFNIYMDSQQTINLQLMATMAREKIEFASGSLVKVVDRTPARKDAKPLALGEESRTRESPRKPATEPA